ncbi:MAG: ABC-F family ATP-binding cassette domain-containing protein, partial [Candidatus Omnitrophica bacterium]|nr:ABC-F family ATP-binding cassette domain-containing protein [Candidatus Omnitrophota bacterium]
SEPNMLLLDEPTNFLDIVSIRWLEKFLKTWRGELMLISHDRDLVDSVATHIVGIHRGSTRKMRGSTAKYYEQLYKDEEIYEKKRINDEKKRKQVMEYVSSFRAKARHAKSVQSSLKRLEKMGSIEKLGGIHTLAFSFNHSPIAAKEIMSAHNLKFSYDGGEPFLIDGLSFNVDKHDKICVIGKNGKGKTTLLKLLAGRLRPAAGKVKTHSGTLMAYYEQANTAELNDNLTVEEEISSSRAFLDRTSVRGICGAMMFPGDDALKKISVLSGGERSRVLLGKQLALSSNLLLLDEPTHHLDIESCQAMIDAVRDFEGAAIVVTHDEHFLKDVATKLIVFQSNGVLVYPGTYLEFLERIGWEEDDKKSSGKKDDRKDCRRARAEFIQERSRILRPLEDRIKHLEKQIADSDSRMAITTESMIEASEKGDAKIITDLAREMKSLKETIDGSYDELEKTIDDYEREKKRLNGPSSIDKPPGF